MIRRIDQLIHHLVYDKFKGYWIQHYYPSHREVLIFKKTLNVIKYFGRMYIFALIPIIPMFNHILSTYNKLEYLRY